VGSGKGWKSAKQAEQEARQAARRDEFKNARKGNGPAPGYREANAGCLLALVLLPLALLRRAWGR
jgi:hypothetical protein